MRPAPEFQPVSAKRPLKLKAANVKKDEEKEEKVGEKLSSVKGDVGEVGEQTLEGAMRQLNTA